MTEQCEKSLTLGIKPRRRIASSLRATIGPRLSNADRTASLAVPVGGTCGERHPLSKDEVQLNLAITNYGVPACLCLDL